MVKILEFLINHVVFIMLEGGTLLFLFLYLLDRLDFLRTNWLKSLLYVMMYLILSYFLIDHRDLPLPVFYIIFSSLLLSHLTNTGLSISFIVNLISYLVYGIAEMAVSIPVLALLDLSFNTAMQDGILQMKVLLIIRPLQTALIYLITRLPLKSKLFHKKGIQMNKSSTAYHLFILFLMSVFYSNLTKYMQDTKVLVASGLIFASVVILGILDTSERIKLMDIKNQLSLQQEYSRNMEFIVDAVRKEKHDYKNHISTLIALCTIGDADTIDRIRTYAQKLTSNEFQSGFHFYNTGNKYLDGLLAMKKHTADQKEIHFEVDVEMSLSNLHVDDVDLTTIVGNIVDNAFDAVMTNPPDKMKIVALSIYAEDNKCYIAVSNNGSEIAEPHKRHIFDYKYSTKNKAAGERGYGLYIVRDLTMKNNGEVTFHSNELETEFLISFRMDGVA